MSDNTNNEMKVYFTMSSKNRNSIEIAAKMCIGITCTHELCLFMDQHGSWISMDHGSAWISMDQHGSAWIMDHGSWDHDSTVTVDGQ